MYSQDFGGDYRLGLAGAAGTFLIFFSTNLYASRACCKVWESATSQRLRFRLHSFTGGEGKIVETPLSNARLISSTVAKSSTLIPVNINGYGRNILIDRSGAFYENDKLLWTLARNAEVARETKGAAVVDSKEKRIEWQQTVAKKRRQREAL
jgi:hypothetical protein